MMAQLKNLATCKPTEFLMQTNKIRKAVERWLADTDIMNIRKVMPKLMPVEGDENEQARIIQDNNKAISEQVKKNFSKMLDAVLEEHPNETLEIIALCCFVEPENVDDYTVADYLNSVNELINNEAVIGFFASLVQLGKKNISI